MRIETYAGVVSTTETVELVLQIPRHPLLFLACVLRPAGKGIAGIFDLFIQIARRPLLFLSCVRPRVGAVFCRRPRIRHKPVPAAERIAAAIELSGQIGRHPGLFVLCMVPSVFPLILPWLVRWVVTALTGPAFHQAGPPLK